MRLSEYEPIEKLMILMKGESGTGKTTAIASFPEPIYIACCDDRIAPLKYNPKVKNRDIDFDIFTDYTSILKKLDGFASGSKYKTIAIDPLFGYARLVINHCIQSRGGATEMSMGKGEKIPLNIGGIPIMAINEYKGEESALFNLSMLLRVIRKHGSNVILTAHVITSEQSTLGGGSTTTRRILTGGNKIGAEIPTYFDEVYHFYNTAGGLSEEPCFKAITASNGVDFARTSFYGLKKEIEFTDKLFYEELISAINDTQKENVNV